VSLYSQRQTGVLLVLVAAAGVGLGVGHWRRARPDLAEWLERLDQPADDPRPAVAAAPGSAEAPPGDGTSSALQAPRAVETTGADGAPRESPVPESPATATTSARPTAAEPSARPPAPPLDLNRASLAELVRLPGVGPALAARIVLAREVDGPFASVDDLRRVRGLRRATFERLRTLVTVAR
jgi:competence protein ComEA